MTNSTFLSKTCQICGFQKPLSAFLQLSDNKIADNKTAEYSAICITCRKNEQDKESSEDSTTSTANHRIGHEQKIARDIDKQEYSKQKEENYHKERDIEKLEESDTFNKKEAKLKDEKKHRETYLKGNKKQKNPNTVNRFLFGGVEQTEQEAKFNLNAPFIDTAMPKLKHQSVIFKQFITWLGPNAPIVKAAGKELSKNNHKKPAASSSEYIEKKWVPPTRRSGK